MPGVPTPEQVLVGAEITLSVATISWITSWIIVASFIAFPVVRVMNISSYSVLEISTTNQFLSCELITTDSCYILL